MGRVRAEYRILRRMWHFLTIVRIQWLADREVSETNPKQSIELSRVLHGRRGDAWGECELRGFRHHDERLCTVNRFGIDTEFSALSQGKTN
jgi:hypothetical protein